MGYHKRLDPEVIARNESLREQFIQTDQYEFALSDWLAEQASEFEFTKAFDDAFEAWLDDIHDEGE